MVSLNTLLALGGIGAAFLIFKNLGGAAGIGSSIGKGFNVFGTNLAAGLNFGEDALKNLNKFDNPLNKSVPDGYRLDTTETRNYDDYINYNDPTPTPTDNPPFVFPDPPSSKPNDNFMDQFKFTDRTPTPVSTVIQQEDVPFATLPAYAGTLDYVVKTNFPNMRTASTLEKGFLQSFGIGV